MNFELTFYNYSLILPPANFQDVLGIIILLIKFSSQEYI